MRIDDPPSGGGAGVCRSRLNPRIAAIPSDRQPAVQWGERSEGVSPPGVPLEEMGYVPGTPVIRDGHLVPSDAPGFGIEATLDWLEDRTL